MARNMRQMKDGEQTSDVGPLVSHLALVQDGTRTCATGFQNDERLTSTDLHGDLKGQRRLNIVPKTRSEKEIVLKSLTTVQTDRNEAPYALNA